MGEEAGGRGRVEAEANAGRGSLAAGALVFLYVLFGFCGPAAAQGWQVRTGQGYVQAFVKDSAGKNALVVQCLTPKKKLLVEIEFAKPQSWSWRDGGVVSMRVDGKVYPLQPAGTDTSIILHNAPELGFSPQLLQVIMKGSGMLALEGPGAERLTPQERTFPLTKAGPVLEQVDRACRRT